jgi:hypothetical protein
MTKKERLAEQQKAYRARVKYTFDFISMDIYGAQRRNSKKRGHVMPAYTLEDLRGWMNNQPNLRSLMEEYAASEDRNMRPSCDRENDDLPYTFDNIQLGSWKENHDKETAKKSKAIIQLTLEGEFIREWSSASEAGRELGIAQQAISAACKGTYKTAGKCKWEFK